jgi:hypothetical protein
VLLPRLLVGCQFRLLPFQRPLKQFSGRGFSFRRSVAVLKQKLRCSNARGCAVEPLPADVFAQNWKSIVAEL